MQKRIALPALLAVLFTTTAFAQMGGGGNKPSPAASASCDLGGGKTIKTDYSSPRMRGRKVLTSINIRRSAHAGLSPACSGTGLATMQVVLRKTSKDQ